MKYIFNRVKSALGIKEPLDHFDNEDVNMVRDVATNVKKFTENLSKDMRQARVQNIHTDFELAQSPNDTHKIYLYRKVNQHPQAGRGHTYNALKLEIDAFPTRGGKLFYQIYKREAKPVDTKTLKSFTAYKKIGDGIGNRNSIVGLLNTKKDSLINEEEENNWNNWLDLEDQKNLPPPPEYV